MKDYSMYKYYKGEAENPFDRANMGVSYMFWCYEAQFEHRYNEGEGNDKSKRAALADYLKALFIHMSDWTQSSEQKYASMYELGDSTAA
jgi:hypothetical protein